MTFNEAYTRIWDMLGSDSLLFIFGNKLRKLFGIYENEDYEITRENLSNYLEPHFKQIDRSIFKYYTYSHLKIHII
jgi:hypothetical protein